MSGIYIKGMEMPEACCACPCSYDNQCAVTHQYPTFEEWHEDKPDWCPLVERRRGTWVPFASHAALGMFYKCSECGKTGDAAWAGCPWCLAVMDKAPEEAK